MSYNPKLIIFSAPSGSGKSTIINRLLADGMEMEFSISATSRAPRGSEQDGVEYYFLSPEAFKEKIAENAFVEYEEVYENRFYGTLKSEIERIASKGKATVFDVDVKGGLNIKKIYGQQALTLFIQPPSVEELRRRLQGRATDAPEVIEQRLQKAAFEMSFASQYDYVIVNEDLEKAIQETKTIIQAFLSC
ncbi:MAG: guanylate kinase [Paludibacteraceae bacterium]|nr:guanylate kinase [Paludibacteraceae bacterium]